MMKFIIDTHGQARGTFKTIQASLDLNPGSVKTGQLDDAFFINAYCGDKEAW